MKWSGESTHHSRSPTSTLNGCDLTQWTQTQSSEQEYGDLTASNRHLSTPCSHIIPQSFSRGTWPYTFPRSMKHVHTSLACSQDFSKICWRVEMFSVVLRPRQTPPWVSSNFGFPGILAYTLPGGLAKRSRGIQLWFSRHLGIHSSWGISKKKPGWLVHSPLSPFCVWGRSSC